MDKDTNQITDPMSKLYQNRTLLRLSTCISLLILVTTIFGFGGNSVEFYISPVNLHPISLVIFIK